MVQDLPYLLCFVIILYFFSFIYNWIYDEFIYYDYYYY